MVDSSTNSGRLLAIMAPQLKVWPWELPKEPLLSKTLASTKTASLPEFGTQSVSSFALELGIMHWNQQTEWCRVSDENMTELMSRQYISDSEIPLSWIGHSAQNNLEIDQGSVRLKSPMLSEKKTAAS